MKMILIHRFTPGRISPGLPEEQDWVMHKNMCPVDNIEIPLIINSPGEIVGLHYSINTINSIKGCTQKESDAIFAQINKDLFVEKYMYDHWYQNNNDLCLFDNSITLHRRLGNIDGRLCYRTTFDYTNLQSGPYQPYSQPEYQQKYNKQIRDIVKILEIENFKLPSRTWRDFIPFRKAA